MYFIKHKYIFFLRQNCFVDVITEWVNSWTETTGENLYQRRKLNEWLRLQVGGPLDWYSLMCAITTSI